MSENNYNCDHLKPLSRLLEPDPRNSSFVKLCRQTGEIKPVEANDYHKAVSAYTLHEGVPEDIVIQFETAKNLYLHAWFVYRFYPVVYLQAYACLELALRDAYGDEIPKEEYYPRSKKPMLRSLLRYAIEKGDVRNEGFEDWFNRSEMRARANFENAIREEMVEKGLDSISYRDEDIKVEDHDLQWDYVGHLLDRIPDTRNHFAHGSKTLHNHSLESIKVVSEIINQIY